VIFSLVPLGSVLGVPAGTFIGEVAGWRTAFVTMGILSVVVFAALVITVPALSPQRPTRMSELGKMLRGTNTRFALTMTFLIVIAHFSTYTYVTPFLEDVTLAGSFTITVVLLAFGAAGMAGNFICGSTVSRYPRAPNDLGDRLRRGPGLLANLVRQGGSSIDRGVVGAVHRVVPGDHRRRGARRRPRRRPLLACGDHGPGRRHRPAHGPGRICAPCETSPLVRSAELIVASGDQPPTAAILVTPGEDVAIAYGFGRLTASGRRAG
jgi:hypothetical protein